jgi:uncharacterized protein YoxC
MEAIGIMIGIAIFIISILLIRWIGAWMLRIDEVIKELKKINKSINNNKQ